ncbi:MAG: hypothetical protein SNH55_04525 [Rikenellaceae bacterium]
MEKKLQELTQKLYDEGLQKGRSEADGVVAKAKADAAKIIEDAKAEAAKIVATAESKAADLTKNSLTEISLAGKQALSKIKAEIINAVITKSISEGVKAAVIDGAFISEMVLSVAKNWNGSEGGAVTLEALLPESQKILLEVSMAKSTATLLKAGVEVGYSSEVKSGFKVGAKDGGYYISFSDEDFDSLMRGYLRERVSKLLFNA